MLATSADHTIRIPLSSIPEEMHDRSQEFIDYSDDDEYETKFNASKFQSTLSIGGGENLYD